jgi:hypothetical protein
VKRDTFRVFALDQKRESVGPVRNGTINAETILKTREFGPVHAVGAEHGPKSERTREMSGHTVGIDGYAHSRRGR